MTFQSVYGFHIPFFCLFFQIDKKKGLSCSTTSHRDTYKCSVKVYLIKGG